MALLTPQNRPLLRTAAVQRLWPYLTIPNVLHTVRKAGFDAPDLLYVDSPTQYDWWQGLHPHRSLFRMADNPAGFARHTPAAQAALGSIIRSVDVVAYTAEELEATVRELGAQRTLYLPNGVDYAHFASPSPAPSDYAALPAGPIALYVGAMEDWFCFDWVTQAAQRLPEWQFVLVGPEHMAKERLPSLPNVHLMGPRPFAALPGFIQHAQVGLIPFDAMGHAALVHTINPLKLYEYMAGGLPVVAARWRLLDRLDSPAMLVDDADAFTAAIVQARQLPRRPCREFAVDYTWDARVHTLLHELGLHDASALQHESNFKVK